MFNEETIDVNKKEIIDFDEIFNFIKNFYKGMENATYLQSDLIIPLKKTEE